MMGELAMRSVTVILCGLVFLVLLSPGEVLAEGAIRIDELNELPTIIDAEAEAWATSKRTNTKVTHELRNVWYDEGSIEPLRTVLSAQRKSPQEIFVANRLLSPFIFAKPSVIAKAMGLVHSTATRLAQYKPLPRYTKERLKTFELADNAPADRRKVVEKRRAEKRKKELEVQKHNEQVHALRGIVFKLMVLARVAEEDTRLLKALVDSEKTGDWMYADILEAIRSQTRRMKKDRAKVFYQALREFWNDLRARSGGSSREYVNQGAVKIEPVGNSQFVRQKDIAKKRTLTVINQVASAARMPALRDPKTIKPKRKPPKKPKKPRRTRR